MIIDNSLVFSDAQAITESAAGTNYVNQGAAGDAYDAPWLVVKVNTAFTSDDSGTVTVKLQTDSDSGFATELKNLFVSDTFDVDDLTAGAVLVKVRIPVGVLQYLRVYYTVENTFTAGAVDAFMAVDVNL